MKKLLVILLCVAIMPRAYAQLAFDHTEWDCGKISVDGARVFHTFTVINTSNESVRIQNFISSCNCVQVLAQAVTLGGGEMLDVTISFDPSRERGEVHRYVELLDGGGKVLGRFEIRAEITPTT